MQWCLVLTLLSAIYCEFLADYVKLWECSWPHQGNEDNERTLHAMIMADTHLLGPLRGHWLDKLYREWHMKNAFQAATKIFKPDVVFVLGDLFDEGDYVSHSQFQEYVERFHSHFRPTNHAPIVSAVGNHDVGYHYKMHPYFTERFEDYFNNTGVNLYTFKDNHFVFINSMAMENDGCYFCERAYDELLQISEKLECVKNTNKCNDLDAVRNLKEYSRPIILQHFPTYRISDAVCKEHDAPVIERFRENWEVLSKESTDLLGKLLRPRLAFSGHTHDYCLSTNRWHVDEYTVASANWRNKVNPSFLLATFTKSEYAVSKCDMLPQQMVINVYLATAILSIILIVLRVCSKLCKVKSSVKKC